MVKSDCLFVVVCVRLETVPGRLGVNRYNQHPCCEVFSSYFFLVRFRTLEKTNVNVRCSTSSIILVDGFTKHFCFSGTVWVVFCFVFLKISTVFFLIFSTNLV